MRTGCRNTNVVVAKNATTTKHRDIKRKLLHNQNVIMEERFYLSILKRLWIICLIFPTLLWCLRYAAGIFQGGQCSGGVRDVVVLLLS